MRKDIVPLCAAAVLVGLAAIVLAGWIGNRRSESVMGETDVPAGGCDAFRFTGADEDGMVLLRSFYTEAGIGIHDENYLEARMRDGLVLLVDSGTLPEDERRELRSSVGGTDVGLTLRISPEALDSMLDNPRYDGAAVGRAGAVSGTVRGYHFGSVEGPCDFEAA